ncbi:hypothetical protein [Eggerthella sinensis]|uniref:nucleotide-binding protein n=1 Tax=Eggerthella sinensis TaxID=242230 RepID=UPI0022E18F66|nr:hypothetical protein [Eggerthella sinensis]
MKKLKPQLGKSSRSAQRNAVSTLYANLGFMSVDDPLGTIVVTSSVPNEGKTTIALELAEAMARSGKRTLLMECDMRRRSLAGRLGLHASAGVCAVVLGDVDLGQAVVRTAQPNLHFLDAEPGVASPPTSSTRRASTTSSRFWASATTTWSSTRRLWARSSTRPSSARPPTRRCSWCARTSSSAPRWRTPATNCAKRERTSSAP